MNTKDYETIMNIQEIVNEYIGERVTKQLEEKIKREIYLYVYRAKTEERLSKDIKIDIYFIESSVNINVGRISEKSQDNTSDS